MPASDDTDRTRAINLKTLSPTWVEQLDQIATKAVEDQGGLFPAPFMDVAFSMRGKSKPKSFKVTLEYLTHTGTA